MITKTHQAFISLDILNIETFMCTPHLETAGEISLRYISDRRTVGFVYMGESNPDDELSLVNRLLGSKKTIKVRQFSKLLKQKGVFILEPKGLPAGVCNQIEVLSQVTFTEISELKRFKYKGAAIGIGVASSLISKTKDPDPDLSIHAQLISMYIREAILVFERTVLLIETYRPKAILTFNGRFALCKPIWEAARIKSVEIVFHERGADYNRFVLQNRPVHDFSYTRSLIIKNWEDADLEKTRTGHTFFARRKQGDGIGWRSFTGLQEREVVPEKNRRKRIVYFSSSDDEYAAIEDLVGSALFVSQREAIGWLINYVEEAPGTELVIRLHPNKVGASQRERSWWEGLRGNNVTVVKPGNKIDSYALAASADIVVSYGSTMGIEAAYWGTPSILLGEALYSGMGCVYEPLSLQDLTDLLRKRKLSRLPTERCLPYGYYFVTFGTNYVYYKPDSLFSGSFLGVKLTRDPPIASLLIKIGNDLISLLKKHPVAEKFIARLVI